MLNIRRVVLLFISCIIFFKPHYLYGQDPVLIQAWHSEPGIETVRAKILQLQLIDPSLPGPGLKWQLEYSKGLSNTVYWHADSAETLVQSLGYDFLYYEIQASFSENESLTVLWGLEEAGVDSATFTNLPEGIPVYYNLRYFARSADGDFLMSYWSDSLMVIQDNVRPSLDQSLSGIINMSSPADQNWANGDTLLLRIAASDALPGKVMQIGVIEQSHSVEDVFYIQIIPPSAEVDTTIKIPLKTDPKEHIRLSWWVTDIALHESDTQYIDLAIWLPEDGENALVSFPNPFNPLEDNGCKIRVGFDGEQTVHIFDAFGQLVRTLKKRAHEQFVVWDGKNSRNQIAGNGGYIAVLDGKPNIYDKIAILK